MPKIDHGELIQHARDVLEEMSKYSISMDYWSEWRASIDNVDREIAWKFPLEKARGYWEPTKLAQKKETPCQK